MARPLEEITGLPNVVHMGANIAHLCVLISDNLRELTYAMLEPTNQSNYAMTIQTRWWSPPPTLADDKDGAVDGYELIGKTKRGLFKYRKINHANEARTESN